MKPSEGAVVDNYKETEIEEIGKMLNGLIRVLKSRKEGWSLTPDP